jgi:NADPH-dependent curcumin reductase CurA
VTDALLNVVRKFARVAVCGSISTYNKDPREVKVPSPFMKVVYSSTTIRGFIVFDYAARWGEFEKEVHPLVREGQLKFDETVVEGFDKIPEAFAGLFQGKNTGKMVVKVA